MTAFFLFAISLQTEHQFVEIDLMAIKFRTVHAGKLGFAPYADAASAAHAGTVDHNGIQADHRGYIVGFGDIGQEKNFPGIGRNS